MHGGNPNGSVATSDVDSFVYLLFIIFFCWKKELTMKNIATWDSATFLKD